MLLNVPALITPDALHGLASLGHGDELVIADANFPSARIARSAGARLVEMAGADAPAVLAAVLQLLPLDDFEPVAAWTMAVVGDATAVPAPVAQFQQALRQAGQRPAEPLERFAFYERASRSQLLLRCGELRKYGNIILRKGVIARD